MGHGLVNYHTATMASAGTLSSEVKLLRNFEKVYLVVPSMTSNSQIHIQGSEVAGGTFRRICHPAINSSTVSTPNDFSIASAATNRIIPIPNGFAYIKVETTATVDDGCSFKIICADAG
jgi:hypothetical protein